LDITTDYKKIILMIAPNVKISILKRTIEKEFSDLYPKEPPFITSKVEDEYGYSLSNSSNVGDLLKYGSRVYAIPENLYGKKLESEDLPISGDIYDLIHLLRNI